MTPSTVCFGARDDSYGFFRTAKAGNIQINVQIRLRDLSFIEPKLSIQMGMPLEPSHSQPNGHVDNWQKP